MNEQSVKVDYSKTIYKKDTKGNIRQLSVSVMGSAVEQSSGILYGALVPHSYTAKPKNIGKVNETTAEEQAIIEAKAIIVKKLKKDYFESIDDATNKKVILPMLAKDYNKELKKIEWPCKGQPKLDGMRALLMPDGSFYSRQGVKITTIEHIKIKNKRGHILDGELYVHNKSFQENMKLIKKYRKGESEKVQFHVYDIVHESLSYTERLVLLNKYYSNIEGIKLVKTWGIDDEKDLKFLHKANLKMGYEGTIIRWGKEGYKIGGRSSNLLKYKDFIDIAVPIIDVIPSDKNPDQGVFVCKTYTTTVNDGIFKCGMKYSHEDREAILDNKDKYIGQTAEIRFFEYTDDGLPRFPVCVGIRLDK